MIVCYEVRRAAQLELPLHWSMDPTGGRTSPEARSVGIIDATVALCITFILSTLF
jgi:hypothetical protein